MDIKVLQINTARSTEAMNLACEFASKNEISVILISEPNLREVSKPGWFVDKAKSAALKVLNQNMRIEDIEQDNDGFVWVKIQGITFFSCYISPNCDIEEFEDFLNRLEDKTRRVPLKKILIGGDFNSKTRVWGNRINDKRGDILLDWIASNDFVIQNVGTEATFRRNQSASIIDITLTSENISKIVRKWKVLEEESLSDHMFIYFELNMRTNLQREIESTLEETAGWKVTDIDGFIKKFKENMANRRRETTEIGLQEIVEECTKACNAVLPKKIQTRRKPAYWWNAEIASNREECLKAKRILVRANRNRNLSESQKQLMYVQYKKCKKKLKFAIRNSKEVAWSKVRDELDLDIWGLGYRIVTKRAHLHPQIKLDDRKQLEIAKELFPPGNILKAYHEESMQEQKGTPLSHEELKTAVSSIRLRKAAGPDRIPPEIVKAVAETEPDSLLSAYNSLLTQGSFPSSWKRAKLVLIQKDATKNKYRPICLLDIFGKLFERLIANRLVEEIDEKLYCHQYGFRKRRSTVNAMMLIKQIVNEIKKKAPNNRELCVMATLDIRNAFNTAPWSEILDALRQMEVSPYLRNIIADYLSNRFILIGKRFELTMGCGVPQGSILGPILWNIFYNSVLTTKMPIGITVVGFADDTAVICKAKTEVEVTNNMNWALLKLSQAIKARGLTLATEKTEAVILYGGRKFTEASLRVQDCKIETCRQLKYLGVIFDFNCQMKQQIVTCATKAQKSALALSRLMPNVGGPKGSNRKLLAGVTHSILLYAAPVWVEATKYKKYERIMEKVQRQVALRVCSGFRTMSTDAALVLSGIVPIDIQLAIRCRRYHGESGEHNRSAIEIWQDRWSSKNATAVWTKSLIPQLDKWLTRNHGEVDFYLSQMLSGHGWFNAYKKRFHLTETDLCTKCGVVENAEHVFFHCEKWRTNFKEALRDTDISLTPKNCISFMLQSRENWSRVATLARSIVLKLKEESKQ